MMILDLYGVPIHSTIFNDPSFYSYWPQHSVKFRLSPANLKKNMVEHRKRFGKRKRLEIRTIMRILGTDTILTILSSVSEIMSCEDSFFFEICSTVFLIILYTPSFLLEIRLIIKISKNPWYPLICENASFVVFVVN